MEQGVLNVQPAQVGAAPDEVPLCPEAGKPVPQVVAGIPPDRRVAVQSERLTEDLDGQRLNVRQLRCRPTAPQTGLPEYLSHDVFDHAVQPDQGGGSGGTMDFLNISAKLTPLPEAGAGDRSLARLPG